MRRSITPQKSKLTPSKSIGKERSTPAKSPQNKTALDSYLVEAKLRQNRERLTHTLDTYTMLIRSKHPLRCLEHNSTLSIYCQTQNRLLCSNCIFRNNDHKFHKMIPIDKSAQALATNIEKMAIQVESEANCIQKITNMLIDNLASQQANATAALEKLRLHYAEAHRMLDDCLELSELKIQKTVEEIKVKYQTVAAQLSYLKDVYTIHPSLKVPLSNTDNLQELIYLHSTFATLHKQKRFEGHVQDLTPNVVRLLAEKEVKSLEPLLSLLQKTLKVSCDRA